ncbi:MAG: hydroxymethylglutaryl-CoA reductase [Candidatus Marsarchaeota archaeon]|nr:hydroxymethylglutaryl-CoA reductase [Candidatus Marsarchaeota archaeon]
MEEKKNVEDFLKKLMAGELKIHELSKYVDENTAAEIRRRYLSEKYSLNNNSFTHVERASIDMEDTAKRNISNLIGAIQIPLGFIEINIKGQYAIGQSAVFLATTEGKLVDGIGRAAKALQESGISTRILKDEMTRSVIVNAKTLDDAYKIKEYVLKNSDEIKKSFSESSKHLELKSISTYVIGKTVFIRYGATTGAAMGMNMITIGAHTATLKTLEDLKKKGINADFFTESGNMCIDKKPGHINQILGRGISISAEAIIKRETVEKYFKVTPEKIAKMNYYKNYIGSSMGGAIGNNAHIANILAAIFIAYGQDLAQIVDGASGYDNIEVTDNGDLYISILLPALEIGTFGGGTVRETQKEVLMASGVYGDNDHKGETKYKFAEIIAAAVLAGELNLIAVQAAQELSSSHASLKRG